MLDPRCFHNPIVLSLNTKEKDSVEYSGYDHDVLAEVKHYKEYGKSGKKKHKSGRPQSVLDF